MTQLRTGTFWSFGVAQPTPNANPGPSSRFWVLGSGASDWKHACGCKAGVGHGLQSARAPGRRSRSGTPGIGLPRDEARVATDIGLGSRAGPPTFKAIAVVEHGDAVIGGDAVSKHRSVAGGVQYAARGIAPHIRVARTALAVKTGCRASLAARVRLASATMQTGVVAPQSCHASY